MDGGGPLSEQVASIAELYDEIAGVLDQAFPRSRPLWVRGEVQKIAESGGHAYIDLVDPERVGQRQAPTLKVKCWRSRWGPLKAELASNGIFLAAGMTVVISGTLDFYAPRAEVGFILSAVDVTALLGKLAQERAALIEALRVEGLLDAQQRLLVPEVPLSVGLVGSPGTEGFNDFLGQLERSGFSFHVSVARAAVQGQHAPDELSAAIRTLDAAGVDLICVVRGGGSRGDLAAFDAAAVARAIATARTPIWTGIGHTGDESVADLVAHQRHITPTACGGAVVEKVATYDHHIGDAATRIAERATWACVANLQRHVSLRVQLMAAARAHLRQMESEGVRRRALLVSGPHAAIARASTVLGTRATTLAVQANQVVREAAMALDAQRRLLSAYDPARALERGWSITLDAQGQVVRSIEQLDEGAMITTRLSDGVLHSTVTARAASEEEE